MSHFLRLVSERTSIQLGETKGAETVSVFIISTLSWLILSVPQASSNHYLRPNIRRLQLVFSLVLRCLMGPRTFSRALRVLRARRNVLPSRTLCRTS